MSNKLQEALNMLVNGDEEAAKNLARQYMLESSAAILSSLEDNDEIENLDRDQHDDFVGEIEAEEMFDDVDMSDEEEDFLDDEGDMDMDDAEEDLMMDLSDIEDEDEAELEDMVHDIEDRVSDIEIDLDALEAEFDSLDDMDDDMEMSDDDFDIDTEMDDDMEMADDEELPLGDEMEESVDLSKFNVKKEKATTSKSPVTKNKGLGLGGKSAVSKAGGKGKEISTKAGSLAKEGNTVAKGKDALKPAKGEAKKGTKGK